MSQKHIYRWILLMIVVFPFLALPILGCGKNTGGQCFEDDDCDSGFICEGGECVESDECENFFSCETDQDCIDQALSQCVNGCCE